MVMPLVHESRPKCYMCHESFEDVEKLREHQMHVHNTREEEASSPAPGDVNVF